MSCKTVRQHTVHCMEVRDTVARAVIRSGKSHWSKKNKNWSFQKSNTVFVEQYTLEIITAWMCVRIMYRITDWRESVRGTRQVFVDHKIKRNHFMANIWFSTDKLRYLPSRCTGWNTKTWTRIHLHGYSTLIFLFLRRVAGVCIFCQVQSYSYLGWHRIIQHRNFNFGQEEPPMTKSLRIFQICNAVWRSSSESWATGSKPKIRQVPRAVVQEPEPNWLNRNKIQSHHRIWAHQTQT